ncbi:uncharacterized protein MYCFIDRAFT_179772 [Pseudocercospora fijiensis CIRAD86]|uniref:Uncharacterized protein n=1 Tax=Pseudocercospora fijiensis (strain CIRAD86) TaxID=383855 RepID=M2YIC0_PSEFD|nr:uncharacterized protein MYCFIDRAFT_179772 [Pseudocercospora fijiensis CIRAD86]EME77520.1 hypothetical protein MYCFIDRAFT_179772 [Pseudocercospora fijiensis CIRAD86]
MSHTVRRYLLVCRCPSAFNGIISGTSANNLRCTVYRVSRLERGRLGRLSDLPGCDRRGAEPLPRTSLLTDTTTTAQSIPSHRIDVRSLTGPITPMSSQQSPSGRTALSPSPSPSPGSVSPPPTTSGLPPSPPASPLPKQLKKASGLPSLSSARASASSPSRSSSPPSTSESLARQTKLRDIASQIAGLRSDHHAERHSQLHAICLSPYTLADFEHYLLHEHRDRGLSAWWQHRARYEYGAETNALQLWMPGEIHERFIRSFATELTEQLAHTIRNLNGSEWRRVVEALSDVCDTGSPNLKLHWEEDAISYPRQPDASFKHSSHNTTYPTFLLEVAKTESLDKLQRDGHNWISGTQALVKCVVGVHLDPVKNDQRAIISVWRGSREEDEFTIEMPVREEEFRSADGQPVPGMLRLSAWDLLSDSVLAEHFPDLLPATLQSVFIDIPYARLAAMLQKAEAPPDDNIVARDTKKLKGPKRKRSSSPEELSDNAEANFVAHEAKAQKRAKAEAGPSYHGRRGRHLPAESSRSLRSRPLPVAVSRRNLIAALSTPNTSSFFMARPFFSRAQQRVLAPRHPLRMFCCLGIAWFAQKRIGDFDVSAYRIRASGSKVRHALRDEMTSRMEGQFSFLGLVFERDWELGVQILEGL